MSANSRILTLVLVAGAVVLALIPPFLPPFYVQLLAKVMVTAIFAMSLDLLIGYTGLISFGHAAFFGLGGYALATMAPEADPASLWLTLPAAMLVAAAGAVVVGWFSIRTSGVYFIMITLAFAQMIYFFFNDSKIFGGSDGQFVNFRPTAALFGWEPFSIEGKVPFYYFTLACLVVVYLLITMMLRAPFGQVITGIKVNEHRMRALGYATHRYKLASFVIAGALAGLAGYLNAAQFGFVSPADLSWKHSGDLLMIVILGGAGTLFGPIIGAFIMVLLQDFLADATQDWPLIMGGIIIAVVLFLPNGIAGLLTRLGRRQPAAAVPAAAEEAAR